MSTLRPKHLLLLWWPQKGSSGISQRPKWGNTLFKSNKDKSQFFPKMFHDQIERNKKESKWATIGRNEPKFNLKWSETRWNRFFFQEKCWPFKVSHDEVKGNILIATRDIKATEIVLEEYPAAFGHHAKSRPCCMECLGPAQDPDERCPKCNFPLCKSELCKNYFYETFQVFSPLVSLVVLCILSIFKS